MVALSPALEDRVEKLEVVIHGDPNIDAKGLRKRVDDLESLAQEIRELRLKLEGAATTVKVLAVALGLVGVSNVATLILFLNQLAGGVK